MVECISVTNILALVNVNKGSHFYSSGKQQKQLYGSSHRRSNGMDIRRVRNSRFTTLFAFEFKDGTGFEISILVKFSDINIVSLNMMLDRDNTLMTS